MLWDYWFPGTYEQPTLKWVPDEVERLEKFSQAPDKKHATAKSVFHSYENWLFSERFPGFVNYLGLKILLGITKKE